MVANGFVETVAEARFYLSSTLMSTSLECENNPNGCSTQKRRRRSVRLSSQSETSIAFSANSATSTLVNSCLSDMQDQELIYLDRMQGMNCCHNYAPDVTSSLESPQKLDGIGEATVTECGDCMRVRPTALGRAVLSSSLGPVHGLIVFEELNKARRAVALDTELHLIYLVGGDKYASRHTS